MKDKFGMIFELKEDNRKNRIIRFLLIIIIIELCTFLGKIGAEYSGNNQYIGMFIGFLFTFAILVGQKLQYNFNWLKVMEFLFAIFLPIMVLVGIGGMGLLVLVFWVAIPVIAFALYLCIIICGAVILAPILITDLIYWTFFDKIEPKTDKEKKIESIANKGLYNSANTDIVKDLKKKYDIHDTGIDEEDEYYCENCFKKISEEEWELNDCMCEDCFMDVHTDENGNFQDDKYFNL